MGIFQKLDPYIPCMSNGDLSPPSPLSLLEEISLDDFFGMAPNLGCSHKICHSRASSPDDSFVVELKAEGSPFGRLNTLA